MKMSSVLLLILFPSYFLVLPNWNFLTSVNDLLKEKNIKTYTIDERIYWYIATDKLQKTIEGIVVEKLLIKIHMIFIGLILVLIYIKVI